jgi:uncharacterized protein with GYD domain
MPTFICFLNWTDQGAKNAKESGKRYQAGKNIAEKLGGKLLSSYVTTGQYDVVLTLEMPNGEAMVKYATAITATGNGAQRRCAPTRPMSSANSLPKPQRPSPTGAPSSPSRLDHVAAIVAK